jgi:hypothetical protein
MTQDARRGRRGLHGAENQQRARARERNQGSRGGRAQVGRTVLNLQVDAEGNGVRAEEE